MNKTTKQTKAQRIAELERKLREAEAMQVHQHHFASAELGRLNSDKMAGSAVILTLTTLGGRLTIGPVAIRGGLSNDTIAALKADLVRSYEEAITFKPAGAKDANTRLSAAAPKMLQTLKKCDEALALLDQTQFAGMRMAMRDAIQDATGGLHTQA